MHTIGEAMESCFVREWHRQLWKGFVLCFGIIVEVDMT